MLGLVGDVLAHGCRPVADGLGNLFISYVLMSTILWAVMNALGEMTTFLPVDGVSVPYFVNRFCEPSLAYAGMCDTGLKAGILADVCLQLE